MKRPCLMKLCLLFGMTMSLGGCATAPERPSRPALIGHVVFVDLLDRGDYEEILEDSDEMLSTISGVVSYAAGAHIDTGRSTVLADYDLGLYIGFDSEDAYAEYVNHDQHIDFVSKWKPRLTGLRVYDIHDPTN